MKKNPILAIKNAKLSYEELKTIFDFVYKDTKLYNFTIINCVITGCKGKRLLDAKKNGENIILTHFLGKKLDKSLNFVISENVFDAK